LYGNEVVDVELEVSSYENIIREDLRLLSSCILTDIIRKSYLCWEGRGKAAKTRDITMLEFEKALQDLIAQKEKVLSSDEPNKDSRYKYLEPGIKSSLDGSNIYIHGLLKKQTIIRVAENGVSPRSKSGANASAKRIIQRLLKLPSLDWRQYKVTNYNFTVE